MIDTLFSSIYYIRYNLISLQMQQQQQPQLVGTKKRRHMPHELYGRFSSKADFIRYFRDNRKSPTHTLIDLCAVQLYLPPEYMLNKDFLKAVLTD